MFKRVLVLEAFLRSLTRNSTIRSSVIPCMVALVISIIFFGCSGDIPHIAPPDLPSQHGPQVPITPKDQNLNWRGDIVFPVGWPTEEYNDAFRRLAENADLRCKDSCHDGVGLLLSRRGNQVGRCTVFLLESSVVATNSHCIPEDLKKSGTNAAYRFYVIFPGSGMRFEVSHVIAASDVTNREYSPDYALLKLVGKTNLSPLKVSQNGIRDDKLYTAWRVDSLDSEPARLINRFSLSSMECKAQQNLKLFPFFDNDSSPVATFVDCPIVDGNSGSPLVDPETQEVVGILSAFFIIENTILGGIMKPEEIKEIPRIAVGTNFSCINDFSGRRQLSPQCGADISNEAYVKIFKENYAEALAKADEDLELEKQELINVWLEENSKIFRWKIKEKIREGLVTTWQTSVSPPLEATIECVQNPNSWQSDYETTWLGYSYTMSEAKLEFQLYQWEINVGIDRDFNFFPKTSAYDDSKLKIQFNPRETLKNRVANLQVTREMKILDKILPIDSRQEVPFCD